MRVTQGTTRAPVTRAIYDSPTVVAAGTPKNGTNPDPLARLNGAQDLAEARRPRIDRAAEAKPPGMEQPVEQRILLARVHARHARPLLGEADTARVQAEKVRREEHDALSRDGLKMLEALDPDQRLHPLGRRPPENPPVDEAAKEGAEVRACDRLSIPLAHLREALGEVDARDLAPLWDEPEDDRSRRLADRRHCAKGQETHQPHEGHEP